MNDPDHLSDAEEQLLAEVFDYEAILRAGGKSEAEAAEIVREPEAVAVAVILFQ